MAIILWCFVGMEAASVLSGRAKSQKTVRLTIILSLLIVLAVCFDHFYRDVLSSG